jgi:hypothetical protein
MTCKYKIQHLDTQGQYNQAVKIILITYIIYCRETVSIQKDIKKHQRRLKNIICLAYSELDSL